MDALPQDYTCKKCCGNTSALYKSPPTGDIKTTTNPSASLGDAGEETSPLHHKKGKLNAFVAVQHANSCASGSPV